ncbi:cell division protein FtsQ/DivIB [Atopomonas sediminilitoris]|uniref:cell division protein FtsQ/DivIB n=1 Tax=Atopomonas sediminilitoris TaxID=2919919 RepID=UPI001F4E4E0E|nr:cell division protein FtsQ/DivIB [Atopomonas sediminilitoris]MCJ8170698.1 cell division protein FtsQ/DivIB [Atopomonas sediminilitoris]
MRADPSLRHSHSPARGSKKAPARGASRVVARPPLRERVSISWPSFSWQGFKRVSWPVLLVLFGYGSYELAQRVLPYADRPIARISVQGDLSYVSQQAVQQRMAPFIQASFFHVDIPGMQHSLEQMPWIARVEVRRVWPDQVQVHLEEQLPVARWGNEALLNNAGEAFAPDEVANYQHLPKLWGPRRAQHRVMQEYQMLSQILRPYGFSISRLEQREHGSWHLYTAQGMEIVLGSSHLIEKMRRFVVIYDKALKNKKDQVARVDLRYQQGLAVAWREPATPEAPAQAAQTL